MTTLFEEADNTDPPSPSELLDAPSIKSELDGQRKTSNGASQSDDGINSGI